MRTLRLSLVGMLGLALLCGVGGAVVAQEDEQARTDAVAATEANEAANVSAFLAKDLDAIMATFTEDVVFEDQTFGDYLEGASAVRRMQAAAMNSTDADATELLDRFVSVDGSRAVLVERWIGTNFLGRAFDLPIVLLHEYRDGKIAKESIYYAAGWDAHGRLGQSSPAE